MADVVAPVWRNALLQSVIKDNERGTLTGVAVGQYIMEFANTLAANDVIASKEEAEEFCTTLATSLQLNLGGQLGDDIDQYVQDINFTSLPFTHT